MHPQRTLPALVAGLSITLAAAACGGASVADPPAPTPAGGVGTTAPALSLADGWVRAGAGMTAAFGTVVNRTDAPITLVGGSSPQAGAVELHTMARQSDGSMTMTRKEGGFVVPPSGSLPLAPGGDHVMLLDLPDELVLGDEVTLTMAAQDGRTYAWTLPVRSFPGAEETYSPGTTSHGSTAGTSH